MSEQERPPTDGTAALTIESGAVATAAPTNGHAGGDGPTVIPMGAAPTPQPKNKVAARPDLAEITRSLRQFIPKGTTFEVRILSVVDNPKYGSYTMAGFFDTDHFDLAARIIAHHSPMAEGCYFTINPVDPELKSLANNHLVKRPETTTTDAHILKRIRLIVDSDPARRSAATGKALPPKIPSTDAEKALARERIDAVVAWLTGEMGWPTPILCDSGNGYHAAWDIDLPAEDDMVGRVLDALSHRFSDDQVKIDTTLRNASRIIKVYGSVARKGEDTEDRPHRTARVLTMPVERPSLSRELMEAVAATMPQPETIPQPGPQPKSTRPKGRSKKGGSRLSPEERAALYLDKMEDSVAGQYGHNKIIAAACAARDQFGLNRDALLRVMTEWNNDHAHPPESEKQIAHKVDDAIKAYPRPCLGKLNEHETTPVDIELAWQCVRNHVATDDVKSMFRDVEFIDMLAEVKRQNPTEFTLMRIELKPIKGFTFRDFDSIIRKQIIAVVRQEQEEADAAAGQDGETSNMPSIICNTEQLPEMTAAALLGLKRINTEPHLFSCGSELIRLRKGQDTKPSREILGKDAIRGEIARGANWVKEKTVGEDIIRVGSPPPMEVASDILSLASWDPTIFPLLESVIDCPRFDRNGCLIVTPGYHRESRLWYEPTPGLVIPDIPERPSADDIRRAKFLLMTELLGEFPFEDEASKAHAIEAILTPFVRSMIHGPVMPHDIEASTPGTGKGLLSDVITITAMGRKASPNTETKNDEEWDKRITSILLKDPTYVLFDNINRNLDSGVLASVFTAYPTYSARILGQSKNVELPVRCVWIITANNPTMSVELARRFALIRLKSEIEQPWLRSGFTHPNLIHWATQNRGQLVWASLVLCRAWIVAGQKRGVQTVGSYEEWAEVMGGILDTIEVPGFLANRSKLYEQVNDDIHSWRAFVEHWWAAHQNKTVNSADLLDMAQSNGLLTDIINAKTDQGNKNKLGRELNKKKDAYFKDYRITKCDPDNKGTAQFCLTPRPAVTAGRDRGEL